MIFEDIKYGKIILSYSDEKYYDCVSQANRALIWHLYYLKFDLRDPVGRPKWINKDSNKKYDTLIKYNDTLRQKFMEDHKKCLKWLALDTKE